VSDFIGPPDPAIIAADVAWYRERSDRMWRAIDARNAPCSDRSAIVPLDDQPCNLCCGAGELRDDGGYGFETITICTCAGTGSRAHIITERNDQ
jgi:hypothetical protein